MLPPHEMVARTSAGGGYGVLVKIKDLHVAKRTEDVGFYAGFVGASFMFGRCLNSTAWGIVADRIGRKPVAVLHFLYCQLLDGNNYTISAWCS